MRIRCAAAHTHLIVTTTRWAWFWRKTVLETLSSPLEGRQTPWFSSWSSRKGTVHLFLRPSRSRRILKSCAGWKSLTSPFGGSSTRNHTKAFRDSALWNDLWSMQRKLWAVESRLPKDWKLATGTTSRFNWVARIPPILLLSAVGIWRSYLLYWYMYSTSGKLYIGRHSFLTKKPFRLGDRRPRTWIIPSSSWKLRGKFSGIGTCLRLHLLTTIWSFGWYNWSASWISWVQWHSLASRRRWRHRIWRTWMCT